MRTQYQVQNETGNGKNQKVVENKGRLEVKKYHKTKQPNIQQAIFKPTDFPRSRQNHWTKLNHGNIC